MRTAKTDQTGRMPRLIWVFAGHTAILLVLSCGGSYVNCQCYGRIFELQYDTTNKMACAPSKNSDQPGHPPSLISLHCAKDPRFLHVDSEDFYQTGWTCCWFWSCGGSFCFRTKHQQGHKMSYVTRKPVFWVCDQVTLKLACSATGTICATSWEKLF